MYTTCPACHRHYRILAKQLSAAGGIVRCGFCGEQFNALTRLEDEVTAGVRPAPEKTEGTPVQIPEDQIPEILREPRSKEQPAKGATPLWIGGTVLLVVLLILQLAWFNRDYLLSTWPELRPLVNKLCDRLDCDVARIYQTSDIKLLSRDVRLHPRYPDTLLVNATMVNEAETMQPFPDIQFALFDTSGKMIAARNFKPEEYLDNSIAISEGMSSGQPVHFVLEVTGPTDGAVSFEFRFL